MSATREQTSSAPSMLLRVQAEQIADHYYPPDMGRPSKLGEPDTVQKLLAALRDGNYRETACRVAGLSKQTFYTWLKQAETGDTAAQAFLDAVEKAEAEAEHDLVRNVKRASNQPQFWAAGMTLLERKMPDKWGRGRDDSSAPKVIVQIGIKDSDVSISTLSPVPRNDLACGNQD